MGDVTTPPDPMPGLREQLLAGGARLHDRRRRRQKLARRAGSVAAAVAVLVLGAVAVFSWGATQPVSASVVVTRVGDMWEVVVASDDATAAMVETALRDQGVDAHVDAVPVGPSRVGQFVSGNGAVSPSGGDLSGPSVQFPAGQETVRMMFGRPARSGESYMAFSDAFARGEPLECVEDVRGAPATSALAAVKAAFDEVSVVDENGQSMPDMVDGVVADVIVVDPSRAVVWVQPGRPESDQPADQPQCPKE